MKSPKRNYILLDCNCLDKTKRYNLNIILSPKKRVIIKGKVYNSKKQPSIEAVIEVIQFDSKRNIKEIIGYSYTNNKGEYLFSIEVLPKMYYEIKIYSPLIS